MISGRLVLHRLLDRNKRQCHSRGALRRRKWLLRLGILLLLVSFWSTPALAQELTPRAYWPAPKGTNVIVVGYQYSAGDVVTDPTLPIIGVDSRINFVQLTYIRTLDLAGRTANLQFILPFSWGTTEGFLGGLRSRDVSGATDARAKLSVNLWGAPTLDAVGFQQLRANPRPIIGASILVQFPTGRYDPDKLLNTGTNRWAVKPGVGFILPVRTTWLVEVDLGAWFFGDNDEFLGVTREQAPILAAEFHLVKRIRPGFWAALDLTYYSGGRTTVDGTLRADLQRNSRVGGTLVYPFKRQHAVRGNFSIGATTSSGGDFNNLTVSYVYVWS